MAFRQRVLPLLGASAVGVGIGYYVFDPLLQQYKKDTNGTFVPGPPGSTSLPDLKPHAGATTDLHQRPPIGSSAASGVSGVVSRPGTALEQPEPLPGSVPYGTVSRELENLRTNVHNKGDGAKQTVENKYYDAKSEVKGAWSNAKGNAEDAVNSASRKAEGVKDDVKSGWFSTKSAAEQKADEAANEAKKGWFSAKDKAAEAKEEAKSSWFSTKSAAEQKAEEAKNEARQGWFNLKSKAEDAADDFRSQASSHREQVERNAQQKILAAQYNAEVRAGEVRDRFNSDSRELNGKYRELKQTGKEWKSDLDVKAQEARKQAESEYNSLRNQTQQGYKNLKNEASDGFYNLRDKADSGYESLKTKAADGLDYAGDKLHQGARKVEGTQKAESTGLWNWIFGNARATEKVAANME